MHSRWVEVSCTITFHEEGNIVTPSTHLILNVCIVCVGVCVRDTVQHDIKTGVCVRACVRACVYVCV